MIRYLLFSISIIWNNITWSSFSWVVNNRERNRANQLCEPWLSPVAQIRSVLVPLNKQPIWPVFLSPLHSWKRVCEKRSEEIKHTLRSKALRITSGCVKRQPGKRCSHPFFQTVNNLTIRTLLGKGWKLLSCPVTRSIFPLERKF